jgi:hypothetical protein
LRIRHEITFPYEAMLPASGATLLIWDYTGDVTEGRKSYKSFTAINSSFGLEGLFV